MTGLTKDEIRRGFIALRDELGEDRAKLFLAAIAKGALDPHLTTRMTAFIRQNPEVLEGAAKLAGTFLGTVFRPRRTTRKALEPAAEVVLGLFGGSRPHDGGG